MNTQDETDELDRLRAIEGRAVQAFETGGSADADECWRDGYRAAADAILAYSHGGVRAELDRLRDLAPGPDALAREDAARDVARAWAAYVADWGRGTVERSVAAPLDRLAAAHGLQV